MSKHPLEEILGITFKDKALLKKALTHSSYANEYNIESNERLEFVGDAVIDLLVGKYLYLTENSNEGVMTKKRAQLVCESALAHYAEKINLSQYLYLGNGEEKSGGRSKHALIADAFEALLGAIYLEMGIDKVQKIVDEIVIPNLDFTNDEVIDYKSKLQELLQSDKRTLKYEIISESGEPHNKEFEAQIIMDKSIILGKGKGKSHLKAEQAAAKEALSKLVLGDNNK